MCCADLEGFLQLERLRAPVGDPQHIFNKLLFDATNEALALHYNKVRLKILYRHWWLLQL